MREDHFIVLFYQNLTSLDYQYIKNFHFFRDILFICLSLSHFSFLLKKITIVAHCCKHAFHTFLSMNFSIFASKKSTNLSLDQCY